MIILDWCNLIVLPLSFLFLHFCYFICVLYVQVILIDQLIVVNGISLTLAFSCLYILVKNVSISQLKTQLDCLGFRLSSSFHRLKD